MRKKDKMPRSLLSWWFEKLVVATCRNYSIISIISYGLFSFEANKFMCACHFCWKPNPKRLCNELVCKMFVISSYLRVRFWWKKANSSSFDADPKRNGWNKHSLLRVAMRHVSNNEWVCVEKLMLKTNKQTNERASKQTKMQQQCMCLWAIDIQNTHCLYLCSMRHIWQS